MPVTETALRSALEAYFDPYLKQTLGEARAVTEVSVAGSQVRLNLELGIPVRTYEGALREALAQHLVAAGLDGLTPMMAIGTLSGAFASRGMKSRRRAPRSA